MQVLLLIEFTVLCGTSFNDTTYCLSFFFFRLQQLICLALQIIANLSINSSNHQKLIEADITDCLMQLILPSDEWFYTNHSTKYAKFVKHHAARIMVYLGLEKRLRNKVYLFDLMGN